MSNVSFKNNPSASPPYHGGSYNYKKRFNAAVSVSAGGATLPDPGTTFSDTYGGGGRPDVQLDSVIVTEADTYGLLRSVDVTFTCFTYAAFTSYEPAFLRVRKGDQPNKCSVRINYVESGAPSGGLSFSDMIIYKFGYTLTKDNYIQCTFSAMAAAKLLDEAEAFGASTLAAAGLTFKEPQSADPADVKDVAVTTIPQLMKHKAQGAGAQPTLNVAPTFTDGILVIENPLQTEAPPDPELLNAVATVTKVDFDTSKKIYCTLKWFVDQVNTYLLPKKGALASTTYKCDSGTTGGNVMDGIVSANPFDILLPGSNSVGSTASYIAPGLEPKNQIIVPGTASPPACISGTTGDFSNILLSYDLLLRIFSEATSADNKTDGSEKSNEVPEATKFKLSTLFGRIFDAISAETGGCIKLTTLPDPSGADQILIVPMNKQSTPGSPAVFDPFSGQQAIRECIISCNPASKDTYAIAVGDKDVKSSTVESLSGTQSDTTSGDRDAAKAAIKKIMENDMAATKFNTATVQALRTELTKLVNAAGPADVKGGNVPQEAGQFPLNLSLVIDGTAGFKFGDLITTTFVPPGLKGSTGAFTILKVIHTVQQNDWSTKFETAYTIL